MIKGVFLNPERGVMKVEVVDDLFEYYSLLQCDSIEILRRDINGVRCCVVCDEEGKLKPRPVPSAVNPRDGVELVGNLFICGETDKKGNLTSLNPTQMDLVLRQVRFRKEGGVVIKL